ncbi:MAG: tetratricopeptide repeat protein, partial [Thermoanaerobaculia bacterium]
MNRTTLLLLVTALALLAASCADTAAPPPTVVPTGEDLYLIDPRTGSTTPTTQSIEKRFDAAWRFFLAGNTAEARKRLEDLATRQPAYTPAHLAGAAIDIHERNFERAQATVSRVLEANPNHLAARVYQAELAFRQGQMRQAHALYRDIAALPNAPAFARERVEAAQDAIYTELLKAAQSAPARDSVPLLREALTFDPAAFEPRMLLVQRLVEEKRFDEARREVEPLLSTAADREEVQVALAEIDAGRGRYQEAIVRYERLARRASDAGYGRRLEEIKLLWSDANMPPQYREAAESTAVTRAQLSVLLYWTVPSVRFAQNLPSPPIAIDIAETPGREEIIRAIALGLYEVDGITRRVNPHRAVTASSLNRVIARLLLTRGAPCARPYA